MPSTPRFTPNNVWATTPAGNIDEELTTPTGQTVLARKITPEKAIENGVLARMDFLTASVDKYTRKVKGGKGVPDDTPIIDEALLSDPKAIQDMVMMADMLVPMIVTSPPVALHFTEQTVGKTIVTKMIPEEKRIEMREQRPGLVFTDQIALEDKMFLFEWGIGGIAAFSSFRRDTDGDVGSVESRESRRRKAKRRPGDR